MTLLASLLLGVVALNTTHDEIPDTTTVGDILNLGGYNATNAANWAIGRYDVTNLGPRISAKYTKPDTGIPMTDLAPTVYNAIYAKQDALVSGTNIKTINNQSILGPGNLVIEGGSGGTSNYEMLNNKPRIGGVEVIGNHPIGYYGGQTKIDDYTTTNAVRAIVTGYGYETHAAAATAYLAATNYADAVGANISTNLIGATNTLAAVAHSGDYGDLTGGPEALPNPYPLRFRDFGEKSGGGYYYGDSQIVLYAGANLAFSGTTGGIVLNATVPTISPTDTTFSNATVAVVNDMSNRSVTAAVDAAMTDILGDNWKTTYGGGLAGLIAALVAALTWLKNHRAGSFTATGITTPATTTNGTADLSTLFSSANTSLMGTVRYATAAATTALADRTCNAVTITSSAVTLTFPAAVSGKMRDFLVYIDASGFAEGGSLTITLPSGAAQYGDDFPAITAAGEHLLAVTEIAADTFFVKALEIEEVS